MRFNQLTSGQRMALFRVVEELLLNAAREAESRFTAENRRRGKTGQFLLVDDPVATLRRFPPRFEKSEGGEEFITADGSACRLDYGQPVSYMQTWAQWPASRAVMATLTAFGVEPDNHAEALIELGFYFSYGVVAAVLQGESVLVGIRGDNANHSGRLSAPGGFVKPGQDLATALADELVEEVPGLYQPASHDLVTALAATIRSTLSQQRIGFGPHDRAPSATFCLQVPMLSSGVGEVVRANHEWVGGRLINVPVEEALDALDGKLEMITRRFAGHGLTITAGFAPDVTGPLTVALTEYQTRGRLGSR